MQPHLQYSASTPTLGSSANTAVELPHVTRSIADEVYAFKKQMRAIRNEKRKKQAVKYGKRAAAVGGVVAVAVIGGFAGAAIF
jgi:hypothetical protein